MSEIGTVYTYICCVFVVSLTMFVLYFPLTFHSVCVVCVCFVFGV